MVSGADQPKSSSVRGAATSGPSSLWRAESRIPLSIPLDRRTELAELLASPPRSIRTLRRNVGEPVLGDHGSNHRWCFAMERIAADKRQHARAPVEETLLGHHNPRVLLPWREGRNPQVPVEPWLVGRVEA